MANSKIIIVEGAQGAGKTTVTDYIRDVLPHTNLYRLNGISDSSPLGKEKSAKMYHNLIDYMRNLENLNINLLFDRTFFSEENYCRLGKKDYSFTDEYELLVNNLNNLDFDIYFICLYLSDEFSFEKRLHRDEKSGPAYAKYTAENSIQQQNMYLQMSDELITNYPNIHTYKIATDSMDEWKNEIKNILKI